MGTTAIIGFGCAGYYAAKTLREARPDEVIDVYSDTAEEPTNPMLTTYYVAGKISRDTLFPLGPGKEIARELRLNLYENTPVTAVHAKDRIVVTPIGEKRYDDIVIATGSHPLVPPIQGLPKNNIYVMRTPQDADRLLTTLQSGISSALVIGASWVGIKVVEALYAHNVPTIMADMAPRIFPTATLPQVADIIHERLEQKGIGLKFGSGIAGMREEPDGNVCIFADGSEIKAQIVALCLGLRPTVGFLDKDEIEMGRGVRVNLRMQSSVPHVYAVGDCCEALELITGQQMSVNLWANASIQGTVAGRNIAGIPDEFQGSFIHNITHFLDMDFIGLGDNRRQGELITYRHPTEGWLFQAVMCDNTLGCINLLDNRRISGPAKAALIKRFTSPNESLGESTRLALRQSGLPESIVAKIGGYRHD